MLTRRKNGDVFSETVKTSMLLDLGLNHRHIIISKMQKNTKLRTFLLLNQKF